MLLCDRLKKVTFLISFKMFQIVISFFSDFLLIFPLLNTEENYSESNVAVLIKLTIL